jgi:CheY-like chemotaxis protein
MQYTASESGPIDGAAPLKILVVEDDKATREAICRFIDWVGHEVKAASGPDCAGFLAEELKPDVVICDWQLGHVEQDGIDVAKEMHERYRAKLILITGRSLYELKQRTRNLDVARYIRKPVSLSSIEAALSDLR